MRYAFILKRLVQTIPVLLIILIAVFLMLKVVPGDPARQVAGPRANEATIQAVRKSLGLEEPLPVQFFLYLSRVLRGDFGSSINTGVPVSKIMANSAPVTFTVLLVALLFTVVIAALLSMLSVRREGGILDRVTQIVATIGVGIPSFWMGIMLLSAFALTTGWFPIGGWGDTPAEQLRASVLPALTLAIGVAPILYANLRSSILSVRKADFVDAGRSVGLRGWGLNRHFILRNAAIPPVALLTAIASIMVSGVVVVEATFGLPGLGLSLVEGARTRDFNIVQGLTLLFAVAIVVINLIGDIVLVMLDPRVKL